ncbi:MAG: hypothetical protein HFE77_00390 [Clostridiales bacterium]|nr:hypothetical protein [Clostridiales bacterium]
MYLLKNKTCFETSGVAITVPENYYLLGDSADAAENTLVFTSPDRHFQVVYKVHTNNLGTKEALIDTQMGIYGTCRPIETVMFGGLAGHCATYGDDNEQIYEARLLIEASVAGCTALEVTVRTYHGDIEKVKASPTFKTLLAGIRKV